MTKTVLVVLCITVAMIAATSFNNSDYVFAENQQDRFVWDESRPLRWSDFKGIPGTYPEGFVQRDYEPVAFTWTWMESQWWFEKTTSPSCEYKITRIDVTAYFLPYDSWVQSGYETDYLLKHEQGHFDISEIHVRKFNALENQIFTCPGGTFDTSKINAEISQLWSNNLKESDDMSIQYDAETNGSQDEIKQQEWNNKFASLLGTYETDVSQEEEQTLVPPIYFEFNVETPAFTTVNQGDTVSVLVTISYIRGEIEQVALSATSWSNLGITTWFDDNPVLPTQTTSFFIKTTCGTPPDNYYFDVLGTSESAATSIDSVTVTVKPNSACSNVQPTQTAKYLPYENNQYGFSIKYPSTWQKDETLEIDDDKPNRVTIATFTSPSQTGLYMVGFAENDPTYRGLNDQQFLNKMKKEIANDCQECQDLEFLSADTATHKNGYKLYYAVLTTTMVSAEGTLNPMLTYALIPDGTDLWLIALMLFSSDDSEQLLDEITPMGESFTIFDYEGTQQTSSDEIDELNENGLDLIDNEKYEEAISIFDEIIEKDPSYIHAYNNKGLAFYRLGGYDEEALDYYDMALEIDPNYATALYNKGLLLNDLERYREAIPYLDRALVIEPDYIDALDEKGYALGRLGSYVESLEYYDRALAIEPDNIDVLFDKGFSLAELGKYNEAISYYDLVLEQDPKDVATLNNKGYALYRLGEYDEALVYLNDALEIDPDFTLAQENKDLVLEEISGKPEEGGCLIATASYGSELAPQVQFLREIRDNTVLSTTSGTSFMTAFNTFYYSFSPTVADLERQNPVFKETVKVAITPLLSSLSLLQYVDIDSEQEMLSYGISIILLNIGMYFVAPALIIFKIRNRK